MRWVIAIVLTLCVMPANANPLLCRTIEDARLFTEQRGMQLAWQGIMQGDTMVAEIWQSEDGAWLMALITPMGVSCLQMVGEGGQVMQPRAEAYQEPMVPRP